MLYDTREVKQKKKNCTWKSSISNAMVFNSSKKSVDSPEWFKYITLIKLQQINSNRSHRAKKGEKVRKKEKERKVTITLALVCLHPQVSID